MARTGRTERVIGSRSFGDCWDGCLLVLGCAMLSTLTAPGIVLYQQVCKLDLEGIVAKLKSAPYVSERESTTWFKICNREYSQMVGREELFERERHQEPVAGWHSCAVACEELE